MWISWLFYFAPAFEWRMKVKSLKKKRTQNIYIYFSHLLTSLNTNTILQFQTDFCVHIVTVFSAWMSVLEKENVKYFGCAHTYNHPYIVLCILQPCKHLRPRLNSKPRHKLRVSPDDKFHIRQNQFARPSPPHIFFFFLPQWPRRTSDFVSCEGALRRGRSTAVLPLRSPDRAASSCPYYFEFHLHLEVFIMISRHCSTFMWKTNPDYLEYPIYNFPPSLQYSHWFTLDSYRFRANRGPPLGRLETVSSYPLSSSKPGSLETAGPVIAFFFREGGGPMRTGHQPIRGLFTFCDWQYSGTEPANHNLQNKEEAHL